MKQLHRWKLYFDKDLEESWLNQLAQQGWGMSSFCLGRYTFEPIEPGEYIYRVDLLPSDEEKKQEYFSLLREMGVAAPNGTQAFLPQACELIERPEVQTLRARCRWCWLRSASMSSRCASARSSWRAGMPTMRSCTSSTRSAASGCSPPVP